MQASIAAAHVWWVFYCENVSTSGALVGRVGENPVLDRPLAPPGTRHTWVFQGTLLELPLC